jgi:transposase
VSEILLLSKAQMRRISPLFPRSHGVARADDRLVISGILFSIKHGLQWQDAPRAYGPHKTLYNRFVRWSNQGVFNRILATLGSGTGDCDDLLVDIHHLRAHRTAARMLDQGLFPSMCGGARPNRDGSAAANTNPDH